MSDARATRGRPAPQMQASPILHERGLAAAGDGAAGDDAEHAPGRREARAGHLPSLAQQKSFIVDNVAVLNKETKIAILSIVMMEIGPTISGETGQPRPVVYESGSREVDIDLDAVGELNQEVLTHIYNIVCARRVVLSQPARQ